MKELFPIFTGAVLGLAFAAGTRALSPLWVRAVAVLLAGVTATILSTRVRGELGFRACRHRRGRIGGLDRFDARAACRAAAPTDARGTKRDRRLIGRTVAL